jgi:hypothetical protein
MTGKEASDFSDSLIDFLINHKDKQIQDLYFTITFI